MVIAYTVVAGAVALSAIPGYYVYQSCFGTTED